MTIVIVNGTGGVGKTTFENYCKEFLGEDYVLIVSTVDFVKQLAKEAGWDGSKTPESRAFLSDLKDLLSRAPWGNIPFNKVKRKIKNFEFELDQFDMAKDGVVFVDCREPKEIQKFVDELGAITLLIHNDAVDPANASNHADAEVDDYHYDYYLTNDGTLDEWRTQAKLFCHYLQMKD